MTKRKTRNELIMGNFLKRRENYRKTKDEIENKKREELDIIIYELYRDWGKYETDDKYDYEYEDGKSKDDFKDNLRRVLKYWEKNEVKSEDDFFCRSYVVKIWEEINDKEDWIYNVSPSDYNWSDKKYEKTMDYNQRELNSMYGDLKKRLSYFELNGVFEQEYFDTKMTEMKNRQTFNKLEYEEDILNDSKTVKKDFSPKKHYFNVSGIISKGSVELFDILKNIFPNTSIEKEHYLIDTRSLRLDFYLEFENRMIGIEYQGIQHFEEVDYFGGENKLVKQKEWDENKRKICENLGIELIYFYHYENLSEELVRKKLCVK
jgi:hypothetical protein